MSNPLYNVPGLGGYVAAKEQNERREGQELQKLTTVAGLAQLLKQQAQQDELRAQQQAFRQEIGALGPEPSTEAVLKVAGKYSNPDKLLDLHFRHQDRQQAAKQSALQFAQNLELRQQGLNQQREAFLQRTTDAQARQQFEEFYKGESLRLREQSDALNAQLRSMGLDIQRQGQQQGQRDRQDRAVTGFANELQQNKIPALSSSITTANDLLSQYEDKDIPGFGVVEGSGMVPNAVRGEESKRVRSAVQAVSNDLLNLYSGLAVTLPEAERRELEEMRGGNFTSADFKSAWPRIVNRYNTVLGNLRAGANADVLREYQSRPGAMKLDPLKPAFAERRQGPKKGDVVDGWEFLGGDPADQKSWKKK